MKKQLVEEDDTVSFVVQDVGRSLFAIFLFVSQSSSSHLLSLHKIIKQI